MTDHSPNAAKRFALDCDDYGRFSAQPIDGDIEQMVPLKTRATFILDESNSSGDAAVDDSRADGGDEETSGDSCRSALSEAQCGCQHDFDNNAPPVDASRSRCGDTNLLGTMMALTLLFALCELIFGFVNNSLALIADSFHMFSDSAALIVAIVAIRLAVRPENSDDAHTFGWKRAEVIGALINGVYLASVCVYILLEALFRLIEPEELENPWQIFAVGVAGFAINAVGVLLFFSHRSLAHHGHSHSHGHGHEHSHDNDKFRGEKRKTSSVNMHGVFLHIAGDAIGSIIVVLTALITIYVPYSWRVYFDPVCSIIFALIILRSSLPLVAHSSKILMQSAPSSVSLAALRGAIFAVDGVCGVHEFHVWNMADGYTIATVHLVLTNMCNAAQVIETCNAIFCEYGIHRTTVQCEITRRKIAF